MTSAAILARLIPLEQERDNYLRQVDTLHEWLGQVDPKFYQKDPAKWTQEMEDAKDKYHALMDAIKEPRVRFFMAQRNRGNLSSHEHHYKLAELAMDWGQVALDAANARIRFLVKWNTAYESVSDTRNHIGEMMTKLNSASKALFYARKSQEKIARLLSKA